MASIKLVSFQFETLIKNKIESFVEEYLTAKFPTNKPSVKYLDYEPSEMQIAANKEFDGVIAFFAREIPFPDTTETAEQEARPSYEVHSYGFGDPIEDTENPGEWETSVKEAQNRAEIFTSLVFDAIMDRVEKEEMFQPEITKADKLVFTEKGILSITKYEPFGAVKSNRGICIYKSMYNLRVEEVPPTEPLGPDYTGSDLTIESLPPA